MTKAEFLRHFAELPEAEQLRIIAEAMLLLMRLGAEIPEATRDQARALGVTVANVYPN